MIPENLKIVLLSPRRYERRRERFRLSLEKDGGFLNEVGVEWFVATPYESSSPPSGYWWRHVRRLPHYWAATCDHLSIMEKALVEKVDHLIVLEDDACFVEDFDRKFREAFRLLPPGWRSLQLNWNMKSRVATGGPGLLLGAGRNSGMMANLWSREGIKRFYSHAWSRRNHIICASYDDLRRKEPLGFYRPAEELVVSDPLARQKGRDR